MLTVLTVKKAVGLLSLLAVLAVSAPSGASATGNGTGIPGIPDGSDNPALPYQDMLTCDAVDGASEVPGTLQRFHQNGHEVDLGIAAAPAMVRWYDRDTCEFPTVQGVLMVEDIGPTCVRVRVETFQADGASIGVRNSVPLCGDLHYGVDDQAIYLVGVGQPEGDLASVEVTTEIQDGNGDWLDLMTSTINRYDG